MKKLLGIREKGGRKNGVGTFAGVAFGMGEDKKDTECNKMHLKGVP